MSHDFLSRSDANQLEEPDKNINCPKIQPDLPLKELIPSTVGGTPMIAPAEGPFLNEDEELHMKAPADMPLVNEDDLGSSEEEEDLDLDSYFKKLLSEIKPKYSPPLEKALWKEFRKSPVRTKLELIQGLQDNINEQTQTSSSSSQSSATAVEPVEQFPAERHHVSNEKSETEIRKSQIANALDLDDDNIDHEGVDLAWRDLLEEHLPPEQRQALNEQYEREPSYRKRYHMLLEFSGYLRQSTAFREETSSSSQTEKSKNGLRQRRKVAQAQRSGGGCDPKYSLKSEKELEMLFGKRKRGASVGAGSVTFLAIGLLLVLFLLSKPDLLVSYFSQGISDMN